MENEIQNEIQNTESTLPNTGELAYLGMPVYKPAERPKKHFELSGADRIISLVLLAVSVFFTITAFHHGMNLGFTIAYYAAFICSLGLLIPMKKKPGIFALICGISAFCGGAVFTLTSDGGIKFFTFVMICVDAVIFFSALAGKRAKSGDLTLASHILRRSFPDTFACLPASVAALLGIGSKSKKRSGIAIGILCAVPVLCAVIPLLSNADDAFSGLIHKFLPALGSDFFCIIAAVIIFVIGISFAFALKFYNAGDKPSKDIRRIDSVISASFLSVISLCYLVYLFSQLAYFVSSFRGILPAGYKFSYAEYARKGFFEMCMVAGINLLVIFFTLILTKSEKSGVSVYTKILCVFVSAFTFFFAACALAKLSLYIGHFGLTSDRIIAAAFVIFVAVVFGSVTVRIFTPKAKVLQTAVIAASIIVLILGFGNVNRTVAKYNTEAYLSGKLSSVDIYTIDDCGDEGVPYLAMLYEKASDADVRDEAEYMLAYKEPEYFTVTENGNWTADYEHYYVNVKKEYDKSVFRFNLARRDALEIMLSDFDRLERIYKELSQW